MSITFNEHRHLSTKMSSYARFAVEQNDAAVILLSVFRRHLRDRRRTLRLPSRQHVAISPMRMHQTSWLVQKDFVPP